MPNRALTFLHEIREAITASDRLVLVVGPKAVTSDYVRAEWLYALEIGKAINPVLRLGDYDLMPDELKLLDAPTAATMPITRRGSRRWCGRFPSPWRRWAG